MVGRIQVSVQRVSVRTYEVFREGALVLRDAAQRLGKFSPLALLALVLAVGIVAPGVPQFASNALAQSTTGGTTGGTIEDGEVSPPVNVGPKLQSWMTSIGTNWGIAIAAVLSIFAVIFVLRYFFGKR